MNRQSLYLDKQNNGLGFAQLDVQQHQDRYPQYDLMVHQHLNQMIQTGDN